jgi:hypothetical protein
VICLGPRPMSGVVARPLNFTVSRTLCGNVRFAQCSPWQLW